MKIICLVLTFTLLFTFIASADIIPEDINGKIATEYYTKDIYSEPFVIETAAQPLNIIPEVKAKTYLLMEASTGRILAEKSSHDKLSIASITKIMTLLLVAEEIAKGNLSLSDKVKTTDHAASMGGSQIWLEPNEEMTVNDLLKAAVIASANDASVALAEHISGSEDAFVTQMNNRAKEMKMENTNFKNACGLDEEGHYSSAHDIAIMSRELLHHDIIKNYSTVWMDSLRNGSTQLVNTNKLVRFYSGATGLKTGTTSQAGYCVAASAKRNGMELISVVMAGETSDERFVGARKLLDYGFINYELITPNPKDILPPDIKIIFGKTPVVEIEATEQQNLLIIKGRGKYIEAKYTIEDEIEAPVKERQTVGKITYILDGDIIAENEICIAKDVERVTFGFSLQRLFQKLFSL